MARHTRQRGWHGTWVLAGVGLTAFVLGRAVGPSPAPAQTPAAPAAKQAPVEAPAAPAGSDYASRVVAYIYDTIPITREDLGEYLIQRYGADKLELLVNKKIIDHECVKKGVEVTAAEVEAAFDEDCKGLGVTKQVFLEQFLSARKKTLYEWKEDVIRPRIQLTKLCRERVKVDEEDIQKAFESHYGEKIDVRIILFPQRAGQERVVLNAYNVIRSSDAEFDRAARQQENGALAAAGGKVKPIGRHTAKPEVERAAFSLQPGEVSNVISAQEGFIIMKCDQRLAADKTKEYAKEREALYKEVFERKVQEMVKVIFNEMQTEAKPKKFMQANVIKQGEFDREVQRDLKETDDMLKSAPPKK